MDTAGGQMSHDAFPGAIQRSARVVVASNRASAGVYTDRTGPIIVGWLRERGYTVDEPVVVPDGDPVGAALRTAVTDGVDVVITTGGTGITPSDRTPDVTRALLDYEVPGIADAVRTAGLPAVPTALLSRGVAGVAGRTLIVNLPGSTGGVRDGLGVLAGVLDHAIDQLRGGDHQSLGGDVVNAAFTTPMPVQSGLAAARVPRAEVTGQPLDVTELARLVTDSATGAVVTFEGTVRDHDHGRAVRELEYTSHPSAHETIKAVAEDLAVQHKGVQALAVSHRIGRLGIGDVALACAVAAAHRREAFLACADLVDEVKRRLPIWKHQLFADGTEEWVNCP